MILQTTLSLAAAAAVIHLWLFVRVVQLRMRLKALHGDGGHDALAQRMRAHANYTENTPLFLVLVGAIEMTGKGGTWLAVLGAVFMIARIAHAFGMDIPRTNPLRAGGMMVSLAALVVAAGAAVGIALRLF